MLPRSFTFLPPPPLRPTSFSWERTLLEIRYSSTRCLTRASYISNEDLAVQWQTPDFRGSFGHVYFGRDLRNGVDVVVKCSVDDPFARGLYATEKYVNNKLRDSGVQPRQWAEYLGEVVVPWDEMAVSGVARTGLVWRREEGESLEEILGRGDVGLLASLLGIRLVQPLRATLRRELFAGMVWWLLKMLKSLHHLGLYHRDVKAANVIVTRDKMAPLKAIDFGSTVDWKTPFKRGLNTATCDGVYGPPERKINVFAADRFDIFAVGLLGLRVLLPSLTSETAMRDFIERVVRKNGHDFPRICAAALVGAQEMHPQLKREVELLLDSSNRDIFHVLKFMIRENPKDRLSAEQVLGDSFFDTVRERFGE